MLPGPTLASRSSQRDRAQRIHLGQGLQSYHIMQIEDSISDAVAAAKVAGQQTTKAGSRRVIRQPEQVAGGSADNRSR